MCFIVDIDLIQCDPAVGGCGKMLTRPFFLDRCF